jgi:hypothetical protein
MSYGSLDIIACPNAQDSLTDYFVSGDPTARREDKALTNFLLSDTNRRGVLQNAISVGGGHKRTVELTYFPRVEATSTSATPDCTPTTSITECSTTYEIDTTVGTSNNMTLDLRKLEKGCATDEFYYSKLLMQLFDSVYRKMNITNATQLAALVGNHASTGTSAAVNVTTTASGNYSNDFVQRILFEMAESEIAEVKPVAISGSQKVWNYKNASEFASAVDGLNIDVKDYTASYGFPILYDRDINTSGAFAADEFPVIVPGAVQLLTFNRFAEDSNSVAVIDLGLYKQGTVVDPRTGVRFDYVADYNKCEGLAWDIWVGLSHKLVGMPTDMFNPSDRMEGVTYVYNFKAVAS